MAWEVGGWADDNLVATCVMMQLLGGGSSFSAGEGLDVLGCCVWVDCVVRFS